MKGFEEWWEDNDYLYGQPIAYDEMKQCWEAGKAEGMEEGISLCEKEIDWIGPNQFDAIRDSIRNQDT